MGRCVARRLNVSQRTAPHPRRATTQSSEYSLSRVSPCYASVRSVSPSVQVVPCRFLTYAAGRDCDRHSGGGCRGITCRLRRHGAWRALEGRDVTKTIAHWSLHTCQPSSMTFAVVVVPLPLLPARGWCRLGGPFVLCPFVDDDVNDPGIRHVVMSSIRGPTADLFT